MQLNLFSGQDRKRVTAPTPSVTVAPWRQSDRRRWQDRNRTDIFFSGVGETAVSVGASIARCMSASLRIPMVMVCVEDGGKQRVEKFNPINLPRLPGRLRH